MPAPRVCKSSRHEAKNAHFAMSEYRALTDASLSHETRFIRGIGSDKLSAQTDGLFSNARSL